MDKQAGIDIQANENLSKLIVQELGADPFRKFKTAFALMSVIPFLVFLYLLVVGIVYFDLYFFLRILAGIRNIA
ncbi:MAG: hypothetical protein NTY47_03175 [Candidatus Omnitrophica bacterium]|nr:hypothetical protein [Candidatus Omnitrophota bacterium]